MEAVARVFTEGVLMVLSVLAGPQSPRFLIDAIGPNGYMDTMIVRRTDSGFELYDEMNGELRKYMTITASGQKPHVYTVVTHRGDVQETVEPNAVMPDFDLAKWRRSRRLELEAVDGSRIRLNRSGRMVYLTPQGRGRTFAIHGYKDSEASKQPGRMRQQAAVLTRNMAMALNRFRLDTGRYPTETQGLRALVEDPEIDGWKGPYVKNENGFRDPWGRRLRYGLSTDGGPCVVSSGPDERFGTDDDIVEGSR